MSDETDYEEDDNDKPSIGDRIGNQLGKILGLGLPSIVLVYLIFMGYSDFSSESPLIQIRDLLGIIAVILFMILVEIFRHKSRE